MNVTFSDDDLDRLETDASFDMGLPPHIISVYRRRMQFIRSAPDERDFYAMKSLHYEKLKGKRQHQRSMKLNKQFRLVLEIIETEDSQKWVKVVGIEDYH